MIFDFWDTKIFQKRQKCKIRLGQYSFGNPEYNADEYVREHEPKNNVRMLLMGAGVGINMLRGAGDSLT